MTNFFNVIAQLRWQDAINLYLICLNNLPEHRLCFPQLILHNRDELAPHEVVQKHDIDNVEYKYGTITCVFELKAKILD